MLRSLVSARPSRRFAFFVALVAATGAIALVRTHTDLPLTPNTVRDAIRSWGPVAPLIFTGAFVLRPFIFFPSTLLFLAGGLAFGVAWGTFYAAAGATIGAMIGFTIARILGRDFVQEQFGDRLPDLQQTGWGAGLVALLNLIPIVPMTAINYGAGLSGMELLPFTVATATGLSPRAFAYSFFGHSLLDIRSNEFLLAAGLLLALLVIPLIVQRRVARRANRQTVPRNA
ncbi:MAG: TVP38/TMEM64 family protein [Candidatus Binatia bacterium]